MENYKIGKRITVFRQPNSLRLYIRTPGGLGGLLFILVCLAFWVAGTILVLTELIIGGEGGTGGRVFGLIWLLLWVLLGGPLLIVVGLWIVWCALGKEIVTIERGVLTIRKAIFRWGLQHAFPTSELGEVRYYRAKRLKLVVSGESESSSMPGDPELYAVGVECIEGEQRFGLALKEDEAREVANELKLYLESPKDLNTRGPQGQGLAMRSLHQVIDHPLRWVKIEPWPIKIGLSRNEYQLCSAKEVVATLSRKQPTLARAECADGSWIFEADIPTVLGPGSKITVEVRSARSESALAVFTGRWSKQEGSLQFLGGRKFQLTSREEWKLEDGTGKWLVRFKTAWINLDFEMPKSERPAKPLKWYQAWGTIWKATTPSHINPVLRKVEVSKASSLLPHELPLLIVLGAYLILTWPSTDE